MGIFGLIQPIAKDGRIVLLFKPITYYDLQPLHRLIMGSGVLPS